MPLETKTTIPSGSMSTGAAVVTNSVSLIVVKTDRNSLLLRNIGTVDCYIGLSTVTVPVVGSASILSGFLLKKDETIVLDRTIGAIYGITASSSTTVSYLIE